jgi:hypothetical protein
MIDDWICDERIGPQMHPASLRKTSVHVNSLISEEKSYDIQGKAQHPSESA